MFLEQWIEGLQKRLTLLFPERQFFIRSRGRVRFITLSARQQLRLALVPLGLIIGLAGWATVGFLDKHLTTDPRDERIAALEAEQHRLETERSGLITALEKSKFRNSSIASALQQKHHALAAVMRAKSMLEQQFDGMKLQLSRLGVERTQQQADRTALRQRYVELREQLTRSTYLRPEPEGSLRERLEVRELSLGSAFAKASEHPPAIEQTKSQLEFEATRRLLAMTAAERDEAREQARQQKFALAAQMAHLEDRLASLREMQDKLVARIEIGTERHISDLENMIRLTGLNVDHLLDRVEDGGDGIGGPLVGMGAPEILLNRAPSPRTHPEPFIALQDGFDRALNRMGARLARWSALSAVAERLPVVAPVDAHRISSRFGKRRDPFTKRWARHVGVDLAAERRAPVVAAAPGVITFAGWNGPYGRFVVIDHGYGLKTRYGHLYRIKVKRGDRIDKRQQIGIIGSSGRSTGRHLHYEILFDDQPLDPATFLKAGDHVFKDRQK